jgi:hypothetical protein
VVWRREEGGTLTDTDDGHWSGVMYCAGEDNVRGAKL